MIRHSTLLVSMLSLLLGVSLHAQPVDPMAQRRTAVVEVFEQWRDSVVNIASTQVIQVRASEGIDRLFEDLFAQPGQPRTRQLRRTSVGSGFVIHDQGYIVTNAHVVARTAERKAIFADGSEFDAQVVAIDRTHDLAVLKIAPDPARTLKPVKLGSSGDLMVGETVIAIGNPLGYQHTVTAGVVSALDRTLEVSDDVSFRGLIQTDASINPGNSGGPLLNVLGELVGINTAIRADAQNIGFAIAVDQLRRLLPEMLDIERRYRLVTGLRLSSDARSKVVALDADSPAAKAGIEIGDTLLSIQGQPVRHAFDFHIALVGAKPGDTVKLRLQRADRTLEVALELAERPRPDGVLLLRQKFGITAEPMSAPLAEQLGLSTPAGLIVTRVDSDSPASAINLRRGDILIQLGRYVPQSLDDAGEILESAQPGQAVDLTVLRISGRVIYRTTTSMIAR